MNDDNILKHSTDLGIGTIPQPSGTITFLSGMPVGGFEVMRLSRDGVWVNPDLKPDEVAQAVLNALDAQTKVLVQRAVEAEREACARICDEADKNSDWPTAANCAAAIRSRT